MLAHQPDILSLGEQPSRERLIIEPVLFNDAKRAWDRRTQGSAPPSPGCFSVAPENLIYPFLSRFGEPPIPSVDILALSS